MSQFVAITTTIDPQGGDYGQPRIGLYTNYVTALQRVGLTPVLITPTHKPEAIHDLVGMCCGLVLTGGEDIDPSCYGEDPIPELGLVNPARDFAELRAIDAASELEMPVLGICRGHQLLNVYFGGTLCQDIKVAMETASSHIQTTPWGSHHHEIDIEADSRLAEAVGTQRLQINSYHHQAVKKVADPLMVTARADDGLVEAIEARFDRWIVGVQWHPERFEAEAEESDPNMRLFAAFAGAVKDYQREPRRSRMRSP